MRRTQDKSLKKPEPLKRQQEEESEEEPKSDEGPVIQEEAVMHQLESVEGYWWALIECVSEGSEGEVEHKIQNHTKEFLKVPGIEKEQLENIEGCSQTGG